jgi:MSHA pilin protein MshD
MQYKGMQPIFTRPHTTGFTLLELLVFIVVVSIALGALLGVFNQTVIRSVDPAVKIKALEKGQAMLDEILARPFAENSPVGGMDACDETDQDPCAGIEADSDLDDVGDFNGYTDTAESEFPVRVEVTDAGADLGLPMTYARRIIVTVGMPGGDELVLSAYKVNF